MTKDEFQKLITQLLNEKNSMFFSVRCPHAAKQLDSITPDELILGCKNGKTFHVYICGASRTLYSVSLREIHEDPVDIAWHDLFVLPRCGLFDMQQRVVDEFNDTNRGGIYVRESEKNDDTLKS